MSKNWKSFAVEEDEGRASCSKQRVGQRKRNNVLAFLSNVGWLKLEHITFCKGFWSVHCVRTDEESHEESEWVQRNLFYFLETFFEKSWKFFICSYIALKTYNEFNAWISTRKSDSTFALSSKEKAEGKFCRVDKSCIIEVIWQAIINDNSLSTYAMATNQRNNIT